MHFFSKYHLGYIVLSWIITLSLSTKKKIKWKIDKDEKYTMLKQEAHKQQHEKIFWFTTYINEGHHLYKKKFSFLFSGADL